MPSVETLVEDISKLSLIEASELVKALEEKFGVSASSPVVVAGVADSQSQDAGKAQEEEKTEFNVVLKEIGSSKINVIKAVRSITGLGLKEAKELVEGAPKSVKEGVTKEEAQKLEKELKEAGATVELK